MTNEMYQFSLTVELEYVIDPNEIGRVRGGYRSPDGRVRMSETVTEPTEKYLHRYNREHPTAKIIGVSHTRREQDSPLSRVYFWSEDEQTLIQTAEDLRRIVNNSLGRENLELIVERRRLE